MCRLLIKNQIARQFDSRKKFTVSHLPLQRLIDAEEAKTVSSDALESFYQQRCREGGYVEPERRSGMCWRIDPQSYGITVDNTAVVAYYDDHKAVDFVSEPSKVVVRHIFLAGHSSQERAEAHEQLQVAREKIASDPEQFAEVARSMSQEEHSARNGGLLPAFSRDDTAREHELIRSAFMLQGG